jgi:O-antigen ligase
MTPSCNIRIDSLEESANAGASIRHGFDLLTALLFTLALGCFIFATLHGQALRGITAAVIVGAIIAGASLLRFAVAGWRPGNASHVATALLFAAVILLPSAAAGTTPIPSILLSVAVLASVVGAYACVEAFSRAPSGLLSTNMFMLIITLAASAALAARLALHMFGSSGSIQPWYSLAPADLYTAKPFEHFYAFATLIAFPMSAGAAIRRQGFQKVLYSAAGVCLAIGIVLSFSRAAWIAFVFELLVLIRLDARRRGMIVALGVVCVVALLTVPGAVQRASTLIHTPQGTGTQRLEQWAGAVSLIADHPVLGIGPGAFGSEFRLVRPDGTVTTYPCPHNLYLHIAVECGLPALFLFLTAAVLVLRAFLGKEESGDTGRLRTDFNFFRHAAFASLIGVLVFGFFDL